MGLTPYQEVTPVHEAAAERAMREAGVLGLAGRAMDTLSTGEARRALVARALVHDPAARHRFALTVRELARSGRGLVLVTHHVEDVPPEVTRVVLLKEGRIFANGPKETVLTGEALSGLFGFPAELEERNGVYRLW